ncbi:hypothetical protein N836_05295 [Leptolyngbya sp. Heron Island J]|uniref:hypothetical protein n=1 Tax=Leptolyngbya sp. Heron Island J TaxID=1385935 RepID=UPI0003B9CA5C|nr:hypothetical protein [Leptolyngbya sp. Heron Island J]ESA36979.1 hypothetical protein N836_05295 [Leptolyngbya sp. Heron Island J]
MSTTSLSRPYSRRRRQRLPIRRLSASFAPAGLALLLGTSGALWLTEALIMPKTAHAYTSRLNLFLTLEGDEPYSSLVRRANMAARAGAQRSFDQDLLITEVVINVTGENSDGIAVPVLNLRVSRQEWSQQPITEYWATYFRGAESLLRSGAGPSF